jgi:hypothetical protein
LKEAADAVLSCAEGAAEGEADAEGRLRWREDNLVRNDWDDDKR